MHVLAGHLHVSLFLKGIGCVGEKLPDKYLLVLVEGFCHDLKQTLSFGFKLKVFDLVLLEVQLRRLIEYLRTLGVLGRLFSGKGETGDNGIKGTEGEGGGGNPRKPWKQGGKTQKLSGS